MINNINTLQNLPESAGLQTYTDIYLKQSLANLGQRFSLKGDGVQAGEFSIYELFGHEYDEAAHSNAYIKAEVSENKIVLSYYENTESQLPQEVLPIYGSSYYITTEDIELPGTPILNTEYYGNGGIINKYDEKYVVTFSGYDDESNLTEIISEEYKVGSNIIEDAVRFYYSDADDKVKAVRIHTKPYSHTVDNIYVVKIYESNIKSLNDLHSILFDLVDSVVFGNEEKASPKFIIDTLVDNGFLTLSLEDEATYNEDGNQYVHFDSDIKNVNAEYETYINAFAYDINELFPYLNEYYNKHIYFSESDSLALRRELIIKVFNKIYEDFMMKSVYEDVESISLYLPYNYKFVYSCNSNNPVYIYNSLRDVLVEYTVDPIDDLFKIIGDRNEQMIICDSNDTINIEDKFIVYEYQVSYAKDWVIDDIIVERKYVLPYIDNNGYWCINDVTTSIYARGKIGGQPNIIMTYTDCSLFDGNREVLTSFKRDEITNLDWKEVKYMVRPLDTANNISSSNYHIMTTYMPTNIRALNENLIAWLENSLILNINSVHSELTDESTNITTLSQDLGPNGVVPTFWIMEKKKNKNASGEDDDDYIYEFSYVKEPNHNWAIDTNYLSNAEAVVKHYMNFGIEPDNYEHSWLVFDKISTQFKNSYTDNNVSVWPVFKNFTRDNFTSEFVSDISMEAQYENDANMMIAFFDNVTRANGTGYINGVGQLPESKYFRISDDHKIDSYVNYKNYPYEYIPNAYIRDDDDVYQTIVPVLDLKEIFLRNSTTLNRTNIFSVDNKRNVYNAYFGVSFDDEDKTTVHIGTSSTNPNIGSMTIMDEEEKSNFLTHKKLGVDFDRIDMNGVTHFKCTTWMHQPIGLTGHMYSTTMKATHLGNIKEVSNLYEMKDDLFAYSYIEVFHGSDIAAPRSENICYMNISKAIEKIGIEGFSVDATIIADNDMITYVGNEGEEGFYALQLTSDLTNNESSFDAVEPSAMTNPIEISYYIANDGMPMTVNFREEITLNSKFNRYGLGIIQ